MFNPFKWHLKALGLGVRLLILGALALGALVLAGDVGLLDGLARSLLGF